MTQTRAMDRKMLNRKVRGKYKLEEGYKLKKLRRTPLLEKGRSRLMLLYHAAWPLIIPL